MTGAHNAIKKITITKNPIRSLPQAYCSTICVLILYGNTVKTCTAFRYGIEKRTIGRYLDETYSWGRVLGRLWRRRACSRGG